MSDGDQLRVGIVGAGAIMRHRHLPNLRGIDGVEVVSLANRHPDSARAVAEEFAIGEVHARWQDVVSAPDVDAVMIGTPPSMHAEVTLAALTSGKHVFCQARMATDLASAVRMLEADRRTERTTMLCPAPHYMAVDAHVRRLMADGSSVGEVRHVVVHHAGSMFAAPDQPLHWRQRTDISGVNVLDVGIVAETLHPWVGTVAEVAAMAETWVRERPADRDGRTEVQTPDALSVSGRFHSGATLTALFSGAVRGGEPRITIHGTRGTLTCWPHQATVELSAGDAAPRVYEAPAEERGQWSVEADFVRAVGDGVKGVPSFEDGVRYTAFTEAVLAAARSGQTVAVPQVPPGGQAAATGTKRKRPAR